VSKPRIDHGLGWGAGPVAAGLVGLMILMVGSLAITGRDVQPAPADAGGAARPAEAERAEGTA